MTAPTTAFVPTGNPVRRFVLALVLSAAACLVLWWSAALSPRLVVSPEQYNLVTHEGVVRVTNDGPTAVEVDGVRIDPGDTEAIDVQVPECGTPMRLRARTVLGVTRTVETDGLLNCSR
jgi:hypothetical protein